MLELKLVIQLFQISFKNIYIAALEYREETKIFHKIADLKVDISISLSLSRLLRDIRETHLPNDICGLVKLHLIFNMFVTTPILLVFSEISISAATLNLKTFTIFSTNIFIKRYFERLVHLFQTFIK